MKTVYNARHRVCASNFTRRLEGAEIAVARFARREGDTVWFVTVPVSSKAAVVGVNGYSVSLLVLGDDTKAKRLERLSWDTSVDSWSVSGRQLAHCP